MRNPTPGNIDGLVKLPRLGQTAIPRRVIGGPRSGIGDGGGAGGPVPPGRVIYGGGGGGGAGGGGGTAPPTPPVTFETCPGPEVLIGATQGVAYSVDLNDFFDGFAPEDWTAFVGTLPAGMTVSSSGILSGTPTETGTFQFLYNLSQ